jgi:hypothetical protein
MPLTGDLEIRQDDPTVLVTGSNMLITFSGIFSFNGVIAGNFARRKKFGVFKPDHKKTALA